MLEIVDVNVKFVFAPGKYSSSDCESRYFNWRRMPKIQTKGMSNVFAMCVFLHVD